MPRDYTVTTTSFLFKLYYIISQISRRQCSASTVMCKANTKAYSQQTFLYANFPARIPDFDLKTVSCAEYLTYNWSISQTDFSLLG